MIDIIRRARAVVGRYILRSSIHDHTDRRRNIGDENQLVKFSTSNGGLATLELELE
jgi:UTP-glucose-1-phosphate uridylyltransferase